MKIASREIAVKGWHMDLFCVLLILGLNPITHFFNRSPRIFSPDTIAYVTLARDLFSKGLFYIPSWAHVNNGLIYPLLYPFFIACGNLFSGESLKVAEWVSCLSALAASIPIFLYLKETTNRVVALLTVLLIQINFYYFSVGMRPLSEATFVLTLSWTMFLTLLLFRNSMSNRRGLSLIVGLSCALVFLSRQIGIVVFLFLLGFFLLQALTSYRTERRAFFENILFMALGWLIVIAPYTLIIYHQTGHHPLQQNFSTAGHEVTTTDPEVLAEIQRIENIPDKSYAAIYAKRRLMRKLLPDSSEMLYRVNRKKKEETKYLNYFVSTLGNPKYFLGKIYNNIMYLRDPLGGLILGTFFLFCLSPFFVKSDKMKLPNRLLLPLFILFYLSVVSCFTDKIPRYSHILFPFVLMHIAGELFVYFHAVTSKFKIRLSILVFFFVVYALLLFATPRFFTALRIFPKLEDAETEFHGLRDQVNGEPVFGLSPFSSYLLGGSCRLLPNDSLEKVVKYGKKTGVRWLLVSRTQSAVSEARLYTNTQWYSSPTLERDYPHLVRFCCKTADGAYVLYEIL
ncbi:MAG: glycosyltransferase family 39 protein [Deltaproteobacteria bacterium]|nr:glycosyltransferase family 39 protein [Deltaproteobacteria bacterium]